MNEKDAIADADTYGLFPESTIQNGEVTFLNDLLQDEKVKRRLERINQEIESYLGTDGEPKILYDTAKHLLKAGGKRLRSLLVVLCCEAVGGDIEKALPYAVATEFAQTASLIHDDVIDEDALRRGVESAHEKFGHKMAILAGDLLVAQAVKMIGKYATADLMVQIAEGGIRMCEGEAADMLMQADNPEVMTKDNYLDMVNKKTVSFIKAAATMGATIGEGTDDQIKLLGIFGENLGFAFQIRDDILNIISSTEIAGKAVHSDLLSKRCTYPLVHALEASSMKERESCLQALSEGDVSEALILIKQTDAISTAIELTKEYVTKAKSALVGQYFVTATLLERIADFVLQRLH
ncbi:MAG: polyprenyl synthetase family protein [Candidatus Thorarchaeota archaeon]